MTKFDMSVPFTELNTYTICNECSSSTTSTVMCTVSNLYTKAEVINESMYNEESRYKKEICSGIS
ncbi:hypothetical protein B7P43_G07999 [Cryptotermes secundus]|uniref:Uncharacterized protein n=1 Tax=Cryptotermes secundus TaxID=105785 RepID=A0A2J7PHS1_9NEOP|nr:hypothetical protein B7P43_G07999 [Cryptotermes secundus]